MKKFVAMGALALILAACSQQEASAWINCKFGVGLNWAWQSGGNNLAWGVFRNGQPPCCDWPSCFGPGYGAPAYHAQGFPSYPYPQGAGMTPMAPATSPVPAAGPNVPQFQPSSSLDYDGFQPVNFPMYYQPSYFIPVSYGR
jgi:hypothetical protein